VTRSSAVAERTDPSQAGSWDKLGVLAVSFAPDSSSELCAHLTAAVPALPRPTCCACEAWWRSKPLSSQTLLVELQSLEAACATCWLVLQEVRGLPSAA
jgi:hypothetical protein